MASSISPPIDTYPSLMIFLLSWPDFDWLWLTLAWLALSLCSQWHFFCIFFCKVIDIHQLTLTDSWLNPDFTWLLVIFFDFSWLQYDYWLTFFFTEDEVSARSPWLMEVCVSVVNMYEWVCLCFRLCDGMMYIACMCVQNINGWA